MKKHFFSFLRLALIVLVLFSFSNCEKDEIVTIEHEEATVHNTHAHNRTSYYNIGSQVSNDIVSYLQLKSSNTLNVKFTKTGVTLSDGTYSEREESALGTILTDKEVVIVNERNTKHTFDVRTPNQDNSKTNLIVTETENHLYEYFLRYNFNGSQSEGTFSGTIEAFDNNGSLIGTATIENGVATSVAGTLNPDCPEDDSDTTDTEGNTDSNNTGNPVGGGVSTGNTNPSDPNPSGGGEVVNNDEPCNINVTVVPCNRGFTDPHPPRGEPKCSGSITTFTGCGVSWSFGGRDTANTNNQDPCAGTVGVILSNYESVLDIQGLSQEVIQYLEDHPNVEYEFNFFLNQNGSDEDKKSFIKELLEIIVDEGFNFNAFKFLVQAYLQDQLNGGEIDHDFITSVHPYMNLSNDGVTPSPSGLDAIATYLTIKSAVTRFKHPDWSDIKIQWEVSKDLVHITLDAFGLIPVVGEVADLTNGVLYTIEGDGFNATMSYASAIPFVGWVTTSTKYGIKVVNYASTVSGKVKLIWKISAGGVVEFGNRSLLRKVLQIVDSSIQAHHIIPWAKRHLNLVQKAAKSDNAFHMNELLNGIPLSNSLHLAGHSSYSAKIEEILVHLDNLNPNMSPSEAYNHIRNLANHVKDLFISNPTLNSGQIANLISYP